MDGRNGIVLVARACMCSHLIEFGASKEEKKIACPPPRSFLSPQKGKGNRFRCLL